MTKLERLQKIAREQGKFLAKCAKGHETRKYQITFVEDNDTVWFADLDAVENYLGLKVKEWDGIPKNIR